MGQGASGHGAFTFSCSGGSHPGELVESIRSGPAISIIPFNGAPRGCVGHGARLHDAVHELE
jgi:hypothetical protein